MVNDNFVPPSNNLGWTYRPDWTYYPYSYYLPDPYGNRPYPNGGWDVPRPHCPTCGRCGYAIDPRPAYYYPNVTWSCITTSGSTGEATFTAEPTAQGDTVDA